MTDQRGSVGDEALLSVDDLRASFRKGGGHSLPVLDSANLVLRQDEALGIVGESGSGKTMLCRALIGTLQRRGADITSGSIRFAGRELCNASENVWRRVRGREIGYVPQSSLAGLNPVLNIGTQLVEAITAVESMPRSQSEARALELLERVRIPRARALLREHPHQLSGGMRQRIMIAAALAQRPSLLIGDEPTTSLDVTIQSEILNLISQLRAELGMALILVTHDLAVVEDVCTNVMVMYAGATVEVGRLDLLLDRPRHPYTRALRLSRVDRAVRGRDLEVIPGEPVCVGHWGPGCRFAPRCPLAARLATEGNSSPAELEACWVGGQPKLREVDGRLTACIHAEKMRQL